MTDSTERLRKLRRELERDPGLPARLPEQEAAIVRAALADTDVYAIAQEQRIAEGAVWQILQDAARLAAGRSVERTETGGLGSDTDPGVTGGYGETGFGSLGNEPPTPLPDEPQRQE